MKTLYVRELFFIQNALSVYMRIKVSYEYAH